MLRARLAVLAGVALFAACSVAKDSPLAPPIADETVANGSANTVLVTNSGDAGAGSFRQAIIDANSDASIQHITFQSQAVTIALQQPVVFTGSQPLTINGNGSIVDGSALAAGQSVLLANGGGDLEVRDLTLRDAPGTGLTVAVPSSASGTLRFSLVNVTASGNGLHGVLINDQAQYFNDPNSTDPNGSNASLDVTVARSRILGNGGTALDQDGLRINEGGIGDLRADIRDTHVEGNGGDGIEFDERAGGDVLFSVQGSALVANGGFDASDFDDGIDIDESGDGSIIGKFLHTAANRNFEQGFDLNENDAGDLRVDMTQVEAIKNLEEGIEYEEDDDFAGGGDIVATLHQVTARENGEVDGDAGVKLREKGAGSLDARLFNVESGANFVSGILLREDSSGDLTGLIQDALTAHNADDGISLDENSSGNLAGVVRTSTSANNGGAGLRADQATTGSGALDLVVYTATGNGGGPLITNAGIVVTQKP